MAEKTSMTLDEAVRIATANLWAHKLRSVLTLLGVVIGVTSVIAVVSLVNGLNRYVAEKVFNLGADVFLVNRAPAIITSIDQWEESQKRKKFHFDDYEAIRDDCHRCVAVAASLNKTGQVKYGTDYLSDSAIVGFTHEMPEVYSRELAQGRYFTRLDVLRGSPVCDVGYDVVNKLFPGTDPVGKEIRVDTSECEIIGVGKKRGSVMGQSQDNWVIMPLTTYQKIYGSDNSLRLWVKAAGTQALEPTMDEVRLILRGRRHVAYRDSDDFAMDTNASFLALWGNISGTFFGVMIGIASIALIVGGIVIMNIMLVSVTERTREIGLRKSLGARQSDIRLQFLIESSTIAAIGGAMGVVLGILLAKIVTLTTSLPSSVQFWSVLAGLLMATSVGLFFGVYPASKAARLDPVVALRQE
ncbi:MAG TPA: ABC transporter permease [Candidatus Polarisedimenticolia bacterium]|nr:ABC transporter permease [Candidatus Polarisedimenticolia bacterium]